MSRGSPPDDYVDVATRITAFYEKYPDGRLTRLGEPKILDMGGRPFVVYTALAYRDPEDKRPALGTAWEPFPGPTPFTKDSELMNAETAAWGRAIIAAGIPSKKIASEEEVRARGNMPPPLTDAKAQELKTRIRRVYKEIRDIDPMRVPPGEFNLRLSRAEHEHERMEELFASFEGLRDHLKKEQAA